MEDARDLDRIVERLRQKQPSLAGLQEPLIAEAAVALLLHQAEGSAPELLFIERARAPGDYWSGDMAFPGGRRDLADRSIDRTAAREVLEEIGVQLGEPVARLDDYDARSAKRPWPLVVSPFAYVVKDRPALRLSAEVADAVWWPLGALADQACAVRHTFQRGETRVAVPAVRVAGRLVWGMTYRMLAGFLDAAGLSLAEPP
jgi:8-oxo-dGTP pyrophosphatase MutT (NUDIX family)